MTSAVRGMTLLEILLASTLLAVIAIAIGTWTRIVARSSAQIAGVHAREREASAGVRLLRADLGGSVGIGWQIDDANRRLDVRTTHHLPGESADVRRIVWTCDGDALVRSIEGAGWSGDGARRFAVDVPGCRFEEGHDGTLWLRGGGASAAAGFLLWQGWQR